MSYCLSVMLDDDLEKFKPHFSVVLLAIVSLTKYWKALHG